LISSGTILDDIFHPLLTMYAPYQLQTEFLNLRRLSNNMFSAISFNYLQ